MDAECSSKSRDFQLPVWSWRSLQTSPFQMRPHQKYSWGPYQSTQINNWPWGQRLGAVVYNPKMRLSWGTLGQYSLEDAKLNAGKIMKKPKRKNKSSSQRRALKRKQLLLSTLADSVQPKETSYTSTNSSSIRCDSPIEMSSRASTNRWSRSPSPDFSGGVPQLEPNRARSLSPTPVLSKKSNSSPPIFTALGTVNNNKDKWPKSRSVLDIFLQSLPDNNNLPEKTSRGSDCLPHEEKFTSGDITSLTVPSPKKVCLNRAPLSINNAPSWSSDKDHEIASETKTLKSLDLPSNVEPASCNSSPNIPQERAASVEGAFKENSVDTQSLKNLGKEVAQDEKCSLVTNLFPDDEYDDESQTVSVPEKYSDAFPDHSPTSLIKHRMSLSKLDIDQEVLCDSSPVASQSDSTRNDFPQPSSEAATPVITDSTAQWTFPSLPFSSSDDSLPWTPSPLNFITPIGSFSDIQTEESPSPVKCSGPSKIPDRALPSTLDERESSCDEDGSENLSADEANAGTDSVCDNEMDSDVTLGANYSANSPVESKEKLQSSLLSENEISHNDEAMSLDVTCENPLTPKNVPRSVNTSTSEVLSDVSESSMESLCQTEELLSCDTDDRSVIEERSTSLSQESERSNFPAKFLETSKNDAIKELLKFPSNLSLSEDESEHEAMDSRSPSPIPSLLATDDVSEIGVLATNDSSEDSLQDRISPQQFMNDSSSQSPTEIITDKNNAVGSSLESGETKARYADAGTETFSVTKIISNFQTANQNFSPDTADTDSNNSSVDSERSLVTLQREISFTDNSKTEASTSLSVGNETNQSQVLVEPASNTQQSQDSLPSETSSQSPIDNSNSQSLIAHIPKAAGDADLDILETSDSLVKNNDNESRDNDNDDDDGNAEEKFLSRSELELLEKSHVLSEYSSTIQNENVPAYNDSLGSQSHTISENSDLIKLDPKTDTNIKLFNSSDSAEMSRQSTPETHRDEEEIFSITTDKPFSDTCSSVPGSPCQGKNETLDSSLDCQSSSPQLGGNLDYNDLPFDREINRENKSPICNEDKPDIALMDKTNASNVEEKPELEGTVENSVSEECYSPKSEYQSNDKDELSEYSPMDVLDTSIENSLASFSKSPKSPSDESDVDDISVDLNPCDSDAESDDIYHKPIVGSHDDNHDSSQEMDTSSLDSIHEMDTSVLDRGIEQNIGLKQGLKRKRNSSPLSMKRSLVITEDDSDDQLLETQDRMLASSGGRLLLNKHTCRVFASQTSELQNNETPRDMKKKTKKPTDDLLELYEKSGSKGLFSPKLFHQRKRQRTITTRSSVKKLRRRQPNHDLKYICQKRMDLIKAVEEGNMPKVQELVQDLGPGVQEEKTGSTLLHVAAVHNQVDVLLFLLKLISPNVVNSEGQTPAHLAAVMGHTQILRILSADEEFCHEKLNQHGKTFMDLLSAPLCDAVLGKNKSKVQELLRLGADPDCEVQDVIKGQVPPDISVSTPRQLAIDLGLSSVLQLFPKERPGDVIEETVRPDIVFTVNSIHPKTDRGKQYPDPLELEVTSTEQPANGEDIYPMANNPRGFVCILDYCSFKDRHDLDLEGSMQDTANLAYVFSRMGYAGEIYSCPTAEDTKDILKKVKTLDILKTAGCLIVVINSHGVGEDRFLTSDLNILNAKKTVELFRNSECPSMINKPKLFIFNTGSGLYRENKRAKYNQAMPSRISEPLQDTVCLFSSNKGYASRAYSDSGTPFYSALCSTLSKHAHNKEINDLFREFLKEYAKSSPVTVPELRNIGFYNKFFFNPL